MRKCDKVRFLREMIALFIGAGAGIGPWLGGIIHDLSGDYFWAFAAAQASARSRSAVESRLVSDHKTARPRVEKLSQG